MKAKFLILISISIFYTIDLSAQKSWIEDNMSLNQIPELSKLLTPSDISLRLIGCEYDEAKLAKTSVLNSKSGQADNKMWSYKSEIKKVDGESAEIFLDFSFIGNAQNNGGVAVAFDFGLWSKNNYVMIPASVYNGNRNRIVNRNYAEGLDRTDLYNKDLELTTTLLPHLSLNEGEPSRIEVNTSNTTTPGICVYDRTNKRGFIVLAEQGINSGDNIIDNGFIVEENSDKSKASLIISAPGVREFKPEFIGFSNSPDRGLNLNPGDKISIHLKVYSFKCDGMPAFYDKFMSVRKEVTGENSPRKLLPQSKTSELMTKNIDNRYYDGEEFKFYCPENAAWISFGWIGGLMNTYPMLALNDKLHRDRVLSTFDFAIPRAQGTSGYFYGALNYDGQNFGREGYDEFPEIVLTRKNADVLFWMIKQFMLLKAQGHGSEIKESWEQNIKRLADAFVNTWQTNGEWGNFLNNKTGEIAVYNTTSGAMAIAGLALASEYYNEPIYLAIANEAADYYYNNHFVKLGMTTGGCADILQNADSETAAALMTSMMALYETTGDKKRLSESQDLANLCASWSVSFDYKLPKETPLGALGAKLTGAVWASTQNKHGAPGFCTSSGDPLFKIYRETSDIRYAELMRDIMYAHSEGVRPNGLITERLTYCDADSRGQRGEGDDAKTGWNELNGALMAIEIPGIYVRQDLESIYVFDQIEAKIVVAPEKGKGKNSITIEIHNPTKFDASVSILAEDKEDLKRPLGYTSFTNWERIEVKAGDTVYHTINKKI